MKPELLNLLDRLVDSETLITGPFHSLIICRTGASQAVYRHGGRAFPTLEDLQDFTYPDSAPTPSSPSRPLRPLCEATPAPCEALPL